MKSVLVIGVKGERLIHLKEKDGTYEMIRHPLCDEITIKIRLDDGSWATMKPKSKSKD